MFLTITLVSCFPDKSEVKNNPSKNKVVLKNSIHNRSKDDVQLKIYYAVNQIPEVNAYNFDSLSDNGICHLTITKEKDFYRTIISHTIKGKFEEKFNFCIYEKAELDIRVYMIQ